MVREFWKDSNDSMVASPSENLYYKMYNLKAKVKAWQIQKKQSNCIELKMIEKELSEIADGMKSQSIPWNTQCPDLGT